MLDYFCSDNLYAETWLQALAPSFHALSSHAAQYPLPTFSLPHLSQQAVPTRDAGIAAVRALLLEMGVDGSLFHQKDGRSAVQARCTSDCITDTFPFSGLSRWNLVSPAAIAGTVPLFV